MAPRIRALTGLVAALLLACLTFVNASAEPAGLRFADVSEHQGAINWAAYGAARDAVIVRAHSGWRADYRWAANRAGAEANVKVVGFYQYLVLGRDAVAQADDFVRTVGHLEPNEFAVVDVEEGFGDQSARVQAWLDRVDSKLGGHAWVYTYVGFLSRIRIPKGRTVWMAAYQSRPPAVAFDVWQHSSNGTFPGIAGRTDSNVFPGDLDGLQALAGVRPAVQHARFPNAVAGALVPTGGSWVAGADGGVAAFGAPFFGSLPALGVHPNAPIVAIVPAGPGGYWLVGRDGGIFAFGTAPAVTPYAPLVDVEYARGDRAIVGAQLHDGVLTLIADDGATYDFRVG